MTYTAAHNKLKKLIDGTTKVKLGLVKTHSDVNMNSKYFKYFTNAKVEVKRPADNDAFGTEVTPEQVILTDTEADFQDSGTSLQRAQVVHEEAVAVCFLQQPITDVNPEDVVIVGETESYTVTETRTLDNSLILTR